ncbi:MAG: type I restriction-modification system subunit M [Firmicutes bacterium]|nr:type I restriction-modification system subunit M [Bacillota bacterium]
MPNNHNGLEKRLWEAADKLRANSNLKPSEYSVPVLGLIFLLYADLRFGEAEKEIQKQAAGSRKGITKADYHARGVLYVPEKARYGNLLRLPEGENIGQAINDAMKAIEAENEDLRDALPKIYNRLNNDILIHIMRLLHDPSVLRDGDAIGNIYEYFLGNFAMKEGQKGGEFFTPTTLVQLIVEIIEPFSGKIFDPACGSGGMFVQSARFTERHRGRKTEISIYGQEKISETIRLCRMNLAVHGLAGDIRQANSYYDDPFGSVGKFDYVMSNPPFNVNGVDKDKLWGNPRYPFGLPRPDNANYLWIQEFYSALNETGRAGFVMANSASDARGSEQEIRRKLLETGCVDVMIAISSNFFYTVTLPCTLWFLDKGKAKTDRRDKVLFIDARQIYTQIDRAHREFSPEQVEFIANIVRLYRGEEPETEQGGGEMTREKFPEGRYVDVPGLCKVATLREIEEQGWSLNPGRYVGVLRANGDEIGFRDRLEELAEELEILTLEAHHLEHKVAENITDLLEESK